MRNWQTVGEGCSYPVEKLDWDPGVLKVPPRGSGATAWQASASVAGRRQNPKENPKPGARLKLREEGRQEGSLNKGTRSAIPELFVASMGKRPKLVRPHQPRPPSDVAAGAVGATKPQHSANPPAQLLPELSNHGHEAAMAPGPLLPEMMTMSAPSAMDVDRAGGAEAAVNAANQSLSPVGMQIYWNLSSLDMAVREAAALALVRELRVQQEEFAAGGGRGGAAEVWRGGSLVEFRILRFRW